jgi:nicotinate phosphoribosyltransferase
MSVTIWNDAMKAKDRATAEGILFTDQYQLTMAQLYFRMGAHERPSQFDHFFRSYPNYGSHQAGYCVSAGLGSLLDWMSEARFSENDISYLRHHKGAAGTPIFADDFLGWLKKRGGFEGVSLRAIPEGRVVHPHAPLTVVEGPLANAQLLETALLNQINYQTLIATKAARIRESCQGRLVLEFGVRRAQGRGANAGTRAALIGGADFSSNAGMSHVLGYPPRGTHAHSMVQAFMAMGEGELGAFRAYAGVYPDDCLLLVDTINTLESGVPNAIIVFEELRRTGHKPIGVRLDSGDLAYLSINAAKMLDEAGFADTVIVLSNQLDELVIWQIVSQIRDDAARYGVDADKVIKRLVYGVGTNLITSMGDPALDGVYKLVAIHDKGVWVPAIKISETAAKTLNPGNKAVWRLYDTRNKATADMICLNDEDPRNMMQITLRHPTDHTKFRTLNQNDLSEIEPLLVEVLKEGKRATDLPTIDEMRKLRQADMDRLDAGVKRLINPHTYHVSLSQKLWDLKQELIRSASAFEKTTTSSSLIRPSSMPIQPRMPT